MMDTLQILERLNHIESQLGRLIGQRSIQDFDSTAEVARILGKAEFTVREWARLGRIVADKRATGRGRSLEWMISHTELPRIQSKGLLLR